MKIVGLANFQTFFKKTCTNNPTSEIQIALKYSFELHQLAAEKKKLVQLKQIFGPPYFVRALVNIKSRVS